MKIHISLILIFYNLICLSQEKEWNENDDNTISGIKKFVNEFPEFNYAKACLVESMFNSIPHNYFNKTEKFFTTIDEIEALVNELSLSLSDKEIYKYGRLFAYFDNERISAFTGLWTDKELKERLSPGIIRNKIKSYKVNAIKYRSLAKTRIAQLEKRNISYSQLEEKSFSIHREYSAITKQFFDIPLTGYLRMDPIATETWYIDFSGNEGRQVLVINPFYLDSIQQLRTPWVYLGR